jgi:PiT family inorganic phosphate transporter
MKNPGAKTQDTIRKQSEISAVTSLINDADAEILEMYEDEKYLFQEDNNCTLPSANVQSLDYDEDEMILYKLFEHSNIPILKRVELLKYGLILSGGLIAYNLGSNDLPTALGAISDNTYVFFMGGIALIIGALLFGKGVSETVGMNLVKLSPLAAFVAQLSAGISVFVFTQFGMPVSTTQAIIGGVVGVGLTKGIKTVKWKTLSNIVLGWVSAPSFALIVGYLIEILK